MRRRHYFFAGGGTGGHIYPGIAVARQISKLEPDAGLHFFCSGRKIDTQILSQFNFEYTSLPAKGFSARPGKFIGFAASMWQSYRVAKKVIAGKKPGVLLGIGGFASAPAVYAAHKSRMPIFLLNVDVVPGKANKTLSRFAREIFVQFAGTAQYLAGSKAEITVTGCPLRSGFAHPDGPGAVKLPGLDTSKKTLLITGGSSGAEGINKAVCSLLEKLSEFADEWQIVHLAGQANFQSVKNSYQSVKISYKILPYYDDMPNLLSVADLVIGRSGGGSVAEYAAARTPSICIPYPYHSDKQQLLNANKLAEAGCGVIIEDTGDSNALSRLLWENLEDLIKNDAKRLAMAEACGQIAQPDAAGTIATRLITALNNET